MSSRNIAHAKTHATQLQLDTKTTLTAQALVQIQRHKNTENKTINGDMTPEVLQASRGAKWNSL